MSFIAAQHVVWNYRRHVERGPATLVDAYIVQDSRYRTRIRVCLDDGSVIYRWVHPRNLRLKRPDEPVYPFPI